MFLLDVASMLCSLADPLRRLLKVNDINVIPRLNSTEEIHAFLLSKATPRFVSLARCLLPATVLNLFQPDLESILVELDKLHSGGHISEAQWRDFRSVYAK